MSVSTLFVKAAAFTLVFLLFHEVVAANESVFEHMKAGFLAWAIVGIGWYAVPRLDSPGLVASGLATVLIPWFLMVFWYLAPALLGHRINSLALHVLWSVVITYGGGVAAAVVERSVASPPGRAPDSGLALVVGVVLAVELVLGIAFSLRRPYIDVFQIP